MHDPTILRVKNRSLAAEPNILIRSTAERVLDRLPCDLPIITPLEFEVPEDAY